MAIHPPKAKPAAPKRPDWASPYHGARMTEEEYLSLPEEKPYLEYVDGVVLQKPMPTEDHGRIVMEILLALGLYFRAMRSGDAASERRVRMGDGPDHRLPDVAYWAPGRRNEDDSLPTLAAEVRSKAQTMDSLRSKCRQFRSIGVDVCWLIDPETRTAEVFEGDRDAERLSADGALETARMPGFSLPLAELWAALDRE